MMAALTAVGEEQNSIEPPVAIIVVVTPLVAPSIKNGTSQRAKLP
jgi:hypothetical protein